MSAHGYWRFLFQTSNGSGVTTVAELGMHTSIGGSNVCTGGTPFGTNINSSYPVAQAFDGNASTLCVSSAQPNTIGYHFASPVSIAEYTIQARGDGFLQDCPNSWQFQYSDDGTNWTTVDIRSGDSSWSLGQVQTFAVPATIPIYLDSTAQATASATNTTSATITTNTANGHLLYLMAFCELTAGAPAITGVSGGGLTWTKRKVSNGSAKSSLEVWTARSSGGLSAVPITVTYAANFDDASLWVGAFMGCASPPFDPNASIPAVASYTAATTPTFSGISTNNAHDYLIFAWGVNNSQSFGTAPTGFSQIGSVQNGGGGLYSFLQIAAKSVSAQQSSQTFTWGSTVSGSGIESIFDALTSDAPPTPPGRRRTVVFMG